jgi:hypothetical protein
MKLGVGVLKHPTITSHKGHAWISNTDNEEEGKRKKRKEKLEQERRVADGKYIQ